MGASTDDSDDTLKNIIQEYKRTSEDLAKVAFNGAGREQYVKAIDAELQRMDYDFDGFLTGNTKSEIRFRDMLIDACQSRRIAPPQYLWELGAPFGERAASIDWGSDSPALPDTVRQWIEKRGTTADGLRQKVSRLLPLQIVASKTLVLVSLRQELQGKLREAQTLRRTFESDIDKFEHRVREATTARNITTAHAAMSVPAIRNDLELLRSKRAYTEYLRTLIDALEGATTEIQFIESRSRDDFKMTRFVRGEESRQLVEKLDSTFAKYGGTAFDRKLEVDMNETPEDIWRDLQRTETTTT